MCCFSCFKSSNAWKKHLKCRKVKPSNEEETLRKQKRGLCCFNGGKHSKDEGLSKKKKSKGCFMCKRSPKDDTTSKKKENCGMCCFHCKGSSKDEYSPRKGRKSGMWCFHGKESLRDENSTRKKRKCGMCCFGADNKPLSEDTTVRKNSGRTGCFHCRKPKKKKPKDDKEKAKCGMCCFGADNKPLAEDTTVRKNEGRTGCFRCFGADKPKKEKPMDEKEKAKCGMCCFGADNKPSSEDTPVRKNEGRTGCFRCGKPKKEKPRDEKEKAKCGLCCFGADNKPSSEDTTTRKNEGCTGCFRCRKPKKEKPRDEKEKATSTCAWANPFKGKECCSCFRLCKKGDKATTMPSDGATTMPSDGKPSKQGCTKLAHCSCGCGCWSASAHLKVNKNKNGGKGMLCWKRKEKKLGQLASLVKAMSFQSDSGKHRSAAEAILNIGNGNIASRVFTYRELSEATQNFASESLLGKGGFGKVYKGYLDDTNETIAVKKLDRTGCQGNREFLIEVLMLSLLSHENLVTLLGYCADGDQRILVYEYMPNRSVQDHLFDLPPGRKPLDWNTRMKIALGAAKGLAHLHDAANPPVIFRDLKASNILVDDDFNPKLADFGLAKLGPSGPKHHVSTRVMGTFGYCAPEYALTGKLTLMSDIYTFGVVLLELITGRKAMDTSRPKNEQILVVWAKPLFKDKRNYVGMADPLLAGKFPVKALYQAVAVAAMCLQEGDTNRPLVKDIISALQYLTDAHSRIPTKEFEKCRPEVPEQQTEVSCDSNAPDEEEPWHSSQSSSASQENEEKLERDADIRRPNNEDPQET